MADTPAPRRISAPPAGGPFETALWLLAEGLWPVVVSASDDLRSASPGKAPLEKGWGTRPATRGRLRALFRRHAGAGVGMLLGPRPGVVDVEVDDSARAGPVLARLFPDWPAGTLGWRAVRGEHRVFAWDDRLAGLAPAVVALADGAVELRLGGTGKQVASVCPPTAGSDGTPRAWNGVWAIAPLPEDVFGELARFRSGRERQRRPAARCEVGGSRYGSAALRREARAVAEAEPGTRNATLNRAAFSLGQLVAAGLVTRADVEAALTEAAGAAGLDLGEIARTLRSGVEAGLASPRARPARRG